MRGMNHGHTEANPLMRAVATGGILDPGSSPAALWGSELRHYRQAAGLSQPELAQRIYCSRQLVGAMEELNAKLKGQG